MGKPAARVGDMHLCPMVTGIVPHVGGPILPPGVLTVLIGGVPAATATSMCTCVGPPDTIAMGSTGVFIGGKPAARLGDQCAHGGKITVGLPTVLIGEGGGGGGYAAMPVDVLLDIMQLVPKETQQQIAEIIALKQAAENGTTYADTNPSAKNVSPPDKPSQTDIKNLIQNDGSIAESDLDKLVAGGTQKPFFPSNRIANGFKHETELSDGTTAEIKWHSPDSGAPAGSNSATGWTAQIKIGNKLLGNDGGLYNTPNNKTHIPVKRSTP